VTYCPLPGFRARIPSVARIRVGERGPNAPRKLDHFQLALEPEGAESAKATFIVSDFLMARLARELGQAKTAEEWEKTKRGFRPRRVPIEFITDRPEEWLMVRLSRWAASGPLCHSHGDFAQKSDEDLALPDQQEALRLQDLPTEPSDEQRAMHAEYSIGRATEYTYETRGKGDRQWNVQIGSRELVCDPLTCQHYGKACKPEVRLHVLLPWTPKHSWAAFRSTSWHTASLLTTTIAHIAQQVGGHLGGLRVSLVCQPTRINTPAGRTRYPAVYVEPETSVEALREQAGSIVALQNGEWRKALPSPEEHARDPLEAEAFVQEFHPDAPAIPTWERDFYERAHKAGQTDTWIEATLRACEDPDAADAALEAAGKGGAT